MTDARDDALEEAAKVADDVAKREFDKGEAGDGQAALLEGPRGRGNRSFHPLSPLCVGFGRSGKR